MPEFHSPEDERIYRKVKTRMLCFGLAFRTSLLSLEDLAAELRKMEPTREKKEPRDDHLDDGPYTFCP